LKKLKSLIDNKIKSKTLPCWESSLEVHDELKALLPEFPPMAYFKNGSPQFADQRKAALSGWLEALTRLTGT